MHVISIVMDSKHYVDNFRPVFVAKTAKFPMKKNAGKISVFWKTILYGIKFISAYSPLLEESKYIFFILVSWPDKTQESKICRWLTRFPSVWKTPNFCVTSRFFFPWFFYCNRCEIKINTIQYNTSFFMRKIAVFSTKTGRKLST